MWMVAGCSALSGLKDCLILGGLDGDRNLEFGRGLRTEKWRKREKVSDIEKHATYLTVYDDSGGRKFFLHVDVVLETIWRRPTDERKDLCYQRKFFLTSVWRAASPRVRRGAVFCAGTCCSRQWRRDSDASRCVKKYAGQRRKCFL